jgi:hypothetical protein
LFTPTVLVAIVARLREPGRPTGSQLAPESQAGLTVGLKLMTICARAVAARLKATPNTRTLRNRGLRTDMRKRLAGFPSGAITEIAGEDAETAEAARIRQMPTGQ